MNSPSAECVTQLKAVLPHRVHLPDTRDYRTALGRVFFPDAARRRPSCVVQPVSVEEVSTVMRVAHRTGGTVTVRGGGLSSNCVADDAVMLDLSAHLNTARPEDDRVVVAGGATVGTMLDALAPTGRVVPVGIVDHAGFGLVTRGGVGYLTRSLGLTIDQLVEAELVLPSGEVVHLSDASTGDEADLWWAVRGCAPCFGVVTSAVLRTHPVGPVWVDRMVLGLEALATYFRVAPTLPRDTTMGAVLGYSALSPDEPVLFVYTACASGDESAIDRARSAATTVADVSGTVLYRSETSGTYLTGLPEFAPPGPDGEEPEPIRLPEPGERRGSFFGKAVFTGPTLDSELAEALATQIRGAPTRECRIDFQHTGGALADVGDGDTAFWGRSGEWNIPLNAIWSDPYDGAACLSWAGGTLDALAPHTIGVYSVEVRPGFPETGAEIDAAYGGNLRRLRELRQRHDPMGVLTHYPL
ncbi:FAD-binding oxidoreductase [Rhodococcus sp. IEGM 1305]|uniref:FAD-binding oxidoreductase n=1 Tax=Rhodococcus sp. IEGM 1305 TaxID=3047092 RepID=UPI0024B72396|nr:FAD-binding oxidoreductase [Rhodococcus sp. IEGM 1305]MDI9948163.1 FAD-binding oxidoreductase [Rhodococcus sp. IEGM 1305]